MDRSETAVKISNCTKHFVMLLLNAEKRGNLRVEHLLWHNDIMLGLRVTLWEEIIVLLLFSFPKGTEVLLDVWEKKDLSFVSFVLCS